MLQGQMQHSVAGRQGHGIWIVSGLQKENDGIPVPRFDGLWLWEEGRGCEGGVGVGVLMDDREGNDLNKLPAAASYPAKGREAVVVVVARGVVLDKAFEDIHMAKRCCHVKRCPVGVNWGRVAGVRRGRGG